jgi:tRNA pseudouridine55 synthase
MEPSADNGRILLINKPLQWTSFDVVNKLRYKLKTKKIGHAGTLDPLATGLLIVCVGRMTKRIEEFMGQEKEYTGQFIIGQSTVSHDLETPVTDQKEIGHITEALIRTTATRFVGNLEQVPPQHSAIRIKGKRAYEFAREGNVITLAPRHVTVSAFDIVSIDNAEISFRIVCSKGTYIRSLVRDFGDQLGVGAYLSALCRTRIGDNRLEDAVNVDDVV